MHVYHGPVGEENREPDVGKIYSNFFVDEIKLEQLDNFPDQKVNICQLNL